VAFVVPWITIGIGQVARNLLHPFPARIDLNPGDSNSARLDLHDEEDHVTNRSADPRGIEACKFG
jgi:hypothetical protein